MQPTEALEVMENCLADTYVADPSHAAINVSVVFISRLTGALMRPAVVLMCAAKRRGRRSRVRLDYWTVNPPTVAPTDEKAFTCRYWWSREELLGGLRLASPHARCLV